MPAAPKFRTRHDRIAQFAPYASKNVGLHKSMTLDHVPIPGGHRLKKHIFSVKTVYGKRGPAGAQLSSFLL